MNQKKNSGSSRNMLPFFALAAAILVFALPLWSQKTEVNPPAPKMPVQQVQEPMTAVRGMTPEDIGTFLDGLVPILMERDDIAGIVILVVKDGKVLFSKGYGYSDVEKKTPVIPDQTLFRPGSISKLFTWTAVMQQVEQGKLDLDRDVNDYLDFKIPLAFEKPITLRNIMTHTPGFEEVMQDLIMADASRLTSLGDYVKSHLPERIFPPGTTPAYSNYATAMAGYIVERVSGQDFDSYIDEHIFKPLGMTHCTFRQPLPDALKPLMSSGYTVASKPAKNYELVQAAPAGSAAVTAGEIAHFMIAHLRDGEYEGVRILRPETAKMMHSAQFVAVPGMNSMALGFYEESRNGHRIIGHGGDTQYFHSDLHLMADTDLGFFFSQNSAGKAGTIRAAVWEKFLDRYFPYNVVASPAPADAAQDVKTVAGRYVVSRRAETTVVKVLGVMSQTTVEANEDGTISMSMFKDLNGQPKRYREVAPLVFRNVTGQDRLAFRRADDGSLVMGIDYPFMVFEKISLSRSAGLFLPLIIGCLAVFLLMLVLWPVGGLTRWHHGIKLSLTPAQRRRRRWGRIVCALDLAFLLLLLLFFSLMSKDIGMMSPRYNIWLRLIQIVGWLGVLGTVPALYNAVQSWREKSRWLWSKVAETLIGLACLGFVWFVYAWNLLHWSLRY
jgi:CubicO group peptidase (beta-lactamase class C family)